ncbi:hypothetical protein Rhal01_00436 [Rubritalea halochordaticola]|uniref:Na+/H+ antiporter n=1 Tax=Rubritalea halochordaticola TaxID=714537 RepID=A0ABP9UUY3_9BACT
MRKLTFILTLFITIFGLSSSVIAAGAVEPAYEKEEYHLDADQYAKFPLPLSKYEKKTTEDGKTDLGATLKYRAAQQNGFNLWATIIFVCAIVHTFLAGFFTEMAHKHEKRHQEKIKAEGRTACAKPHDDAKDDVSFRAHLFHFLGEVEAIFGIWVIALVAAIFYFFGISEHGFAEGMGVGFKQVEYYLGKDVNFTEPLFVVIIMAISATRPVVRFAEKIVGSVARLLGGGPAGWWLSVLTITPLLGSFITEPAAMTISAMLLAKWFYSKRPPALFAYATLGLLFVNVSVGGTLTHFAAPPVLMVAAKWNFGLGFMFINFGWKAAIAILASNAIYYAAFRKHFADLAKRLDGTEDNKIKWADREDPIPGWVTLCHLIFLAWTVLTAHYPVLFIGGFMFFIGFTQATGHHQNEVSMKSPLLVGFFLAGLVIHGKCQAWWIEPLLTTFDNKYILMFGSTLLTAFNDNAAITYLASQAPGLPIMSKYAVLAGAVTGGGLTVIANAPNPAGQSLLGKYFDGGVAPAKLAMAAIIPTIICGAAFMSIPTSGMYEDPKPKVEVTATDSHDHDDHKGHDH